MHEIVSVENFHDCILVGFKSKGMEMLGTSVKLWNQIAKTAVFGYISNDSFTVRHRFCEYLSRLN